ncbi:MAG: hypothetical protein HOE30_10430 [Deltaproteobacteria bacterium]|jgi:hypothetical protein|nr:hypothetical protein [Deltaproteobacteria bacterium]MBT4735530.1 hypothetical protein [Candidatus Neomarinimicrobiota bacterium]
MMKDLKEFLEDRGLYDYQEKDIVYPIIEQIRENLELDLTPDLLYVAALSTSAGKTYSYCNAIAPFLVSHTDIMLQIYTSPNHASLHEVYMDVVKSVDSSCEVIMYTDFTGLTPLPSIDPNKNTILISHPTGISSHQNVVHRLTQMISTVVITDEGHKGYMTANGYQASTNAGYNFGSSYTGTWHHTITSLDAVAVFLVTATPLKTTQNTSEYKIISSFFDRDILTFNQAAVRDIYLYSDRAKLFGLDGAPYVTDCGELTFDVIQEKHEEFKTLKSQIADIEDHFDLKKSNMSFIIQGMNNDPNNPNPISAMNIFETLSLDYENQERLALNISESKRISGYSQGRSEAKYNNLNAFTSYNMVQIVNDSDNDIDVMVANNNAGESVNINNSVGIVICKDRHIVKVLDCHQNVVQVLGRQLRWPMIEGINNWTDLAEYRSLMIKRGIPEEVIDFWIDAVYKYDVHIVDSPINAAGVEQFFSVHTWNPTEWDAFLLEQYSKADKALSNVTSTRSRGSSSAFVQDGTSIDRSARCEICPSLPGHPDDPACYTTYVTLGGMSEKDYVTGLHGDHKDGEHSNDNPDNAQTCCSPRHHEKSVANSDYHNKKYRPGP